MAPSPLPAIRVAGERTKVEAAPLPVDVARLTVDLSELPLGGETTAAAGERVQVSSDLREVSMVQSTGLISEIEVQGTRLYTHARTSPFIGSPVMLTPMSASLEGLCHELRPATIRWRGFRAATASADALDFVELRGPYDPIRCTAAAATRREARARALVPGVLYAFRSCAAHCDPGAELERQETLTLIGPPARMMLESSAELDDVTSPHVGTFSIAELDVCASSIGTVSLNLPLEALRGAVDEAVLLGASGARLDVEVRGGRRVEEGSVAVFLSLFQNPVPKAEGAALGPDDAGRLRAGRRIASP